MAPSAILSTPVVELNKAAVSKNAQSSATLAPLDASKMTHSYKKVQASESNASDPASFTDHMITAKWSVKSGWEAPELKPYGPLALEPAASCLHYATECFEGMKAYRGFDGELRLFRPDCNAERMNMSCERIALPSFDEAEFLKLVMELLAVDGEKWLPREKKGECLYIRPSAIGTQAALGVQRPKEALLFIIGCQWAKLDEPVSPLDGVTPGMRLLASTEASCRAWPGGFGFAKVGANYGPSLLAQGEATERGFHQILWLFGPEGMITEAGASNFFVVWRTREGKLQLITAPLGDKIILNGVTRRSVLALARERLNATDKKFAPGVEELEVVERTYFMPELEEAFEEGRVVEAFVCGTAYFVASVSEIHSRGKDLKVPMSEGTNGLYAKLIKNWLHGIMYGKEDHPWGVKIVERGVPAIEA
jgi:branched-chain amino acid aminotransferase